ncbi:MAG TPA: DsrE family protein [Chitinophagaceae bacterium]|nr:DsrE family protein [Chitinophagaceae bacterium]
MRKPALTLLPAILMITIAHSQTSTPIVIKDSASPNQKIYFPVSFYSDSVALLKAFPKLAEQILSVYSEPNKRTYFENSINYYLLEENYKKAAELVDSIQKIDDDNSFDIEFKSYALAKISEKKQAGSFEKIFKKEFSEAFGQLSFRKKAYLSIFDSSTVSYFGKDYASLMEKLHKDNKDSLSLEDSRSVCDKYSLFFIYSKIYPLMSSQIDQQYRQTFPAIKGNKWGGVVPVQGIDEIADPNMQYKLLMELTGFAYKGQDSSAKKEINAGLGTVARQLNLHEAAGIPRKNIDAVVVVHGGAIDVFLTNEKYKKRYGIDNPNIPLIKELQDYGVKIIACGQLLTFAKVEREDLVPGIKQALSAQTVLSTYQLKNYVYYDLSLTE